MKDHVFLWQLPMFLAYVCLWLIAGTYLTRRALIRFAEIPRTKATMGRSFRVNFLAGSAAHVTALVVMGFFLVLGKTYGPKMLWAVIGLALAPVAMLGMSWLVQMNMLALPAKKLRRIVCATTIPMLLALSALGAAAGVPARHIHMNNLALGRCRGNLLKLSAALNRYARRYPGSVAPDLKTIVNGTTVKTTHTECPGRKSKEPGYLYVGIPNEEEGTKKIRLWDRLSNHVGVRQVIFADGRQVHQLGDKEFAELLELPENADVRRLDQEDR